MSSQFSPYDQPPQKFHEPERSSSGGCLLGLALGCLGVFVVCVLLCAGSVWYVQQNAGKLIAGMVREVLVASINGSEIPEGEKTEVIAQIDRVIDAYKAGRIKSEDIEPMMKDLEKSPVFLMIQTWGLEKTHLDPSGLSDEEKEAGRRTINRAFRGLVEGKITQEEFTSIVPQQQGQAQVKIDNGKPVATAKTSQPQALTDEEVRQMLADLKKLADDAEIPDEPFTVDIGDEVKKLVDQALAGRPATQPPATQPPTK